MPPRFRRLDPDAHPYNQLPAITFVPDGGKRLPNDPTILRNLPDHMREVIPTGTVHVIRGTFDTSRITDKYYWRGLGKHPGTLFVVFENRLGDFYLVPAGDRLNVGIDLTRVASLTTTDLVNQDNTDSLTEYADKCRATAQRLLDAADHYDALAADGWGYPDAPGWPSHLRDYKPGPSYAPRPR